MKKLSKISPLNSGDHLKSYRYFFDSTKTASAQITDLFDFIWPTVTAMWNLRWQVSGYLYVGGETITKEELNKRFVNNEKFNRPNLYRSCIEFNWDKQKADFSKIILINLFAYHESWIENILEELGKNTKTRQKNLQFPSLPGKDGILEAINELKTHQSVPIINAFYSIYSGNKKYSFSKLNNLLFAYRYFKECRNCLMHSGGKASQRLVDAGIKYDSLSASDLNMEHKPDFILFSLNDPVQLKIEGVVGFTDIILQIITSCDAEILCCKESENVFIKRVKAFVGLTPKKINSQPKDKIKSLRSIIQQSAFARPNQLDELELLMKSNNVIK